MHARIEKSGFHKGQYVGYSCGEVWRIRRYPHGWKAVIVRAVPGVFTWCDSSTLAGIGEKLDAYDRAYRGQ